MIRLQLKGPGNVKNVLNNVPADLPLNAFKTLVRSKTGLAEDQQSLMVGFPPQLVSATDGATPISSLNIRNGDLVLVTDVATMEKNLTEGGQEGKGWQYPPTIGKGGMMVRKDMPRDNSCLFHSIAFLCAGRSPSSGAANDMRDIISNLVASQPQQYNTTFLGMPNSQYQSMLRNPDFWGGAIELSIFAQNFECEIIAFDYHYLREDIFGEGAGYKRRVFVIFTGNHYDAMVYQPSSSSSEVCVFSTQDTHARERARHFVETLHSGAVAEGKCTLQKEWRKQLRQPERKAPSFEGTGSSGSALGSSTIPTATATTSSSSSSLLEAQTSRPMSGNDGGNWSCEMCTMNNAPEADTCGICAAPRPTPTNAANLSETKYSSSATTPSPTMASAPAASSSTSTSTGASGSSNNDSSGFGPWQCPHCSYDNPRRSLRCDACNQSNPFLPRPATSSLPPPPPPPPSSSSSVPSATSALNGSDASGFMLPADTAWTCEACTYRNPRRSPLCGACHTPNPNADDSDFGSVPLHGSSDIPPSSSMSSSTSSSNATATQQGRRGVIGEFFGAVQAENNARRLAHLWQCPHCHHQNTNRHLAKCHRCQAANPYWEPLPQDPGACVIC